MARRNIAHFTVYIWKGAMRAWGFLLNILWQTV